MGPCMELKLCVPNYPACSVKTPLFLREYFAGAVKRKSESHIPAATCTYGKGSYHRGVRNDVRVEWRDSLVL